MRRLVLVPLVTALVALAAPGQALAESNTQNGLVNVNLQGLALAIPVSVAVPIGVAANVCDVSVLSLQQQTGAPTCNAKNNSTALSEAIAVAMTQPSEGGGPSNQQSGLVNVNIQDLALTVPVSVAIPIGVAANVCGVSVLSLQSQTGSPTCNATNTSDALTRAIGAALAG